MNKFYVVKGNIDTNFPSGNHKPFAVFVKEKTQEEIRWAIENIILPESDKEIKYGLILSPDIEEYDAGFFTKF